jgi:hypothetical protein
MDRVSMDAKNLGGPRYVASVAAQSRKHVLPLKCLARLRECDATVLQFDDEQPEAVMYGR